MRTSNLRYAVFSLCVSLWIPQVAMAQQDIRSDNLADPIVILAVDTSGSMEFLASLGSYPSVVGGLPMVGDAFNATYIGPDRRCVTPRRGGQYPKTRHIQAKEVLTGSYEGYQCKWASRNQVNSGRPVEPTYDDNSLIPHFEPVFDHHARETGLIRRNRELVRFAFASFDGVVTGGDLDSFTSPGESNNWNLGIRGERANFVPLIHTGDLNDPAAGILAAIDVENAVANFLPFSATPLAAMFTDLDHYLSTSFRDDRFASCRDIHIIAITDGQPTYDDCALGEPAHTAARCKRGGQSYPYKRTLETIARLTTNHAMVKIHVIGFALDSAEANVPCRGANGLANIGCIHQMAIRGGTDAKPGDNTQFAHIASDAVELTRTLSRVINGIVDGTSARAPVTVTNRTSTRNAGGGQYQFFGSFQVNVDHHLWSGNLQRRELSCSGGSLQAARVTNFNVALNSRDSRTRNILTPFLHPDRPNEPIGERAYFQTLRPGMSERDELVDLNSPTLVATIGTTELEDRFRVALIEDKDLDYVLELVRGNEERAGRRLGAINHAHAVIVGGPELELNIPGYERFANAVNPVDAPRRTMVYQGAATGLHAFVADDPRGDGTERWLFLPQELQDNQHLQRSSRIHGVDSAPIVRDVRIYRGSLTPDSAYHDPAGDFARDATGYFDIWATIAVGGLRAGGRAYYGLDVSSPTQPRFLFELNPETEARRFSSRTSTDPFLDIAHDKLPERSLLGLTYGRPVVGTVVIKSNEVRTERGIAILPGGQPENPRNPNGQGNAIYVVELATGLILRRFTTYDNDVEKPFTAPVTGSVGAFNTFPGTVISRAFVGDGAGRLLRIDLRSDDPTDWSVAIFHDSRVRAPILIRPSLSAGRNGRITVIYGNGDIDNLEQRDTSSKVISLGEKLVFNDDGTLRTVTAEVNWVLDLGRHEKLTGTPVVANSIAYFPTFVPGARNACAKGRGRVWALDFQGNDPNSTTDLIGRFDPNGRDFDSNQENRPNITLATNRQYFDLDFDSVVLGALTFINSPVCQDDLPNPDDENAQPPRPSSDTAPPGSKLLVQTGSGSSDVPDVQGGFLEIDPNPPGVSGTGPTDVFITSWAPVLD